MGSNETATATTGGPRVIDVFDGNGAPSGQIIYFFGMQIGSRTPSGIGLGSGSRLGRMRRRLELPRELWIEKLSDLCSSPMSSWGPVLFFFRVLDLTVENNPRSPGGKKASGRRTLRACLAGASAPTRPDIPTRSCRRLPVTAGLTTRSVCPQAPDFAPPTHRT